MRYVIVMAATGKLLLANCLVLETRAANSIFQIQDLENSNSVASRLQFAPKARGRIQMPESAGYEHADMCHSVLVYSEMGRRVELYRSHAHFPGAIHRLVTNGSPARRLGARADNRFIHAERERESRIHGSHAAVEQHVIARGRALAIRD